MIPPGSTLRLVSIPLLAVAVPAGFALWAFPAGLAPLRMAGIVVGWVGTGLLLASLLLMLREPRLAKWLGGLERMYRWHHGTGVAAYVLLLAHPLALAANGLSNSPGRPCRRSIRDGRCGPAGSGCWC